MTSSLPYTSLVSGLPATVPFVGPETQERQRGMPFRARIGANENVFGPSPLAIAAMADAAKDVWMYADPENFELRTLLAEKLGVAPENICVGEGIDGLLGYTARLFVSSGTKVVTSLGAYPTFNFHVAGFGGELTFVPFRDDHEDPEALVRKAADLSAALLYFSNPNNPMGTWHSAGAVQTLIDAVPQSTVLCLDEAYHEFAPDGTVPPIDTTRPNILRYRTFSKAYGMAGARIGYVIGHAQTVSAFNKIRNHFGVNRIAVAGAIASLKDDTHLANVREKISAARDRISSIARDNGLQSLPSATNFVAVDCGDTPEFAKRVMDALIADGIFVRMPGAAPMSRCIRVGTGTAADLDKFTEAFPQALARAKA